MAEINRERLRALIQERKTTPRAVSRAVGGNDYLVRDILSGRSKNPRADTMVKLAEHLEVGVEEIMPGATGVIARVTPKSPAELQIVPEFLPVRYKVQAGLWFEVDDYAQEFVGPAQPVAPDPAFSDYPQWLELVEGDSIDQLIRPGGFAHVVDAVGMGYAPRDGDFVVVERRRAGGALRERTVKQVQFTTGGLELWPRSNNPRWNAPLQLDGGAREGEDIEVEIVGLVIGSYSSFRRP